VYERGKSAQEVESEDADLMSTAQDDAVPQEESSGVGDPDVEGAFHAGAVAHDEGFAGQPRKS